MPTIQKKWLFRAIGQYSVITISEEKLIRETFHDGQAPIVTEHTIEALHPSPEATNGVIITKSRDFEGKFNAFPWFNLAENSLGFQWDNFQFDNVVAAQTPEKANDKHAAGYIIYDETLAKPFEALDDDALDEALQSLAKLIQSRDRRIAEKPPTNQEEFKTLLTKGFMLVLTEQGYDRNAALQIFKLTFQAKADRFKSFAEDIRKAMQPQAS